MVTSKLCDCGELSRMMCMCNEFEELIEKDAWADVPFFEDMDYGPEEECIDYGDNDHEWGEYDGGDDGK